MKVICLFIPQLPCQVEQGCDPSLTQKPLIISGGSNLYPAASAEELVLDCCPQAAAAGVRPGMPLNQAEKLCPQAAWRPAREEAYRAAHDCLLAAAGRLSPTVETAVLGLIYLEVSGLERLIGPDSVLVHTLLAEVQACQLEPQVGLAANKFTAQQAARATRLGRGLVVPAGEERAFLAPLPLAALPMDLEMARRLTLLGVHTLGELAALPRAALVRQFGPYAGPLYDLACGIDPRPVQADAPPLAVTVSRELDEPISLQLILTAHLREMAAELAGTLQAQGYQAQGLQLRLQLADQNCAAEMPVKPPSAETAKLTRLTEQLMGRLAPQQPVGALTLISYPLRPEHLGAVQLALFENAHDGRRQRLRETLRRLRTRFGELVVVVASLIGPPPPLTIQVSLGLQGLPRALIWEQQIRPVIAVYESWRERRRWWGRPVWRDYYRLETADGLLRVIYQDLRKEQWLLERRQI